MRFGSFGLPSSQAYLLHAPFATGNITDAGLLDSDIVMPTSYGQPVTPMRTYSGSDFGDTADSAGSKISDPPDFMSFLQHFCNDASVDAGGAFPSEFTSDSPAGRSARLHEQKIVHAPPQQIAPRVSEHTGSDKPYKTESSTSTSPIRKVKAVKRPAPVRPGALSKGGGLDLEKIAKTDPKRARRLAKNRKTAFASRERKRIRQEMVEARLASVEGELADHKTMVATLLANEAHLNERIQQLQAELQRFHAPNKAYGNNLQLMA